jgi:hypothetical protein
MSTGESLLLLIGLLAAPASALCGVLVGAWLSHAARTGKSPVPQQLAQLLGRRRAQAADDEQQKPKQEAARQLTYPPVRS